MTVRPAGAPTAPPHSPTASPVGGLAMLLAFPLGVLIVSVMVALLATAGRWWVLVPVMLLDFAVTAAVSVMTARLLGEDDGADRSSGPTKP